MSEPENDYQLDKKIQIKFEEMPYWVMPRYRHHYVENSYERFSIRLLRNLLDNNSTLLDIGAHYGAYSLFAAKHCGSKVIAMEPVKENFELLTENVAVNKLGKRITVYNMAASDEDGTGEFNIPWASDSAGFYEHPLAQTIKKQTVDMCRADKLIGGQRVDLIKIDTEGHELHVLNGLKKTLKLNPQVKLLIEANPGCLKNAGATVKDLLEVLVNDFDKEVYVISEELFTLYRLTDDIADWREYIAEDGYANLLCVPKSNHRFALFVSHSSSIGGAELAMVEHITSQRLNNLFFHVILPNHGDIESLLIEKGISYNIVPYNFWGYSPNGRNTSQFMEQNVGNMEAVTTISIQAQKLHVHFVINNTVVCPWGLPAARVLRIPLVWFIHEFGDLDSHLSFLYNINDIRKFIVNESDMVICCSDAVRKAIEQAAPNDHSYTIHNALNVEFIQQSAEQACKSVFSNSADVRLCIVGHVQDSKGQTTAIKAVAELKKQKIRAELAIVGAAAPDYLKKINKLIVSLDVANNIHFLGQQTNPQMFVKQADIVLSCSDSEAFGRNVAEAMIIGRPVIGAASGGTLELIEDGVNGLLFTPGDAKQLADSVNKLLDKELAAKLVSNAQKRIRYLLDPLQNAHRLNDLFRQLDTRRDRSFESIFTTEWVNAVRQEINERQEVQALQDRLLTNNQFLEQSNLELRGTIERLLSEQASLTASKSWRLTSPLRRSRAFVRRVMLKEPKPLKAHYSRDVVKVLPGEPRRRLKRTGITKNIHNSGRS
jgi:FkbM family methyltransferase